MELRRIIAVVALCALPFVGQAQQVDVKQVVLGHLGDSYEWHVATVGHRHQAVPLPVIVQDAEGGWHLFSSARLHGGASWEGFSIAAQGNHEGKIVAQDGQRPRRDLSLTKNALALLINSAVLLLLVVPLARWYRRGNKLPPKGVVGAVEMTVEYVNEQVVKPCAGEDHRRYAPYLLTLFFFILVNNLMGLVPFFPGGANLTGNIAVTLVLAVATFLVVNFSGTKAYWKEILWPEVPIWLKVPAPIMPAIEVMGMFTKPFALMVRLFANIFAGHVVILSLVCVVFITAAMGAAVGSLMIFVSVVFGVFMLFLELLVAFIQAYVFTLLSAVFIGMSKVKHAK